MSLPDKKFLTYEQFLLEKEKLTKDFTPFPMLVKKVGFEDVENPLGKLIGKTRNYLFTQTPVTNSNVDKLEFPKDVPVLNYTEHNHLVKKLGIPAKNLYNKPDQSDLVSDKVVFHETFAKSKHVPETVFSKEDAMKLKFPVVAKPAKGKSARGIQKFDTPEELKASKSKFDVFCEAIDLKREFRCFCFKDEIMVLNERLKIKGAKDFLKDKDTKTEFFYKDLSLKSYNKLSELQGLVKECRKKVKLDVYSIDFAEDADGKLWIIEMNSRTGMGVDKMIEVYKYIYKDFYGEDIPKELQKSINDLSKEWNKAYKEIKGDNAVNESKFFNYEEYSILEKYLGQKDHAIITIPSKFGKDVAKFISDEIFVGDLSCFKLDGIYSDGVRKPPARYNVLDLSDESDTKFRNLKTQKREGICDIERCFYLDVGINNTGADERIKFWIRTNPEKVNLDFPASLIELEEIKAALDRIDELLKSKLRGAVLGHEHGITERLNECTTVMGEKDGKNFLFKNRDRSFTPENVVVREIKDGTEIAYYTDQTGWVEGMNEHGVGLVSSLLTTQDPKYTRFGPAFTVSDEPKNDDPSKYGPDVLKALSKAKTAKEALSMLEKSKNLIGSFFIADQKEFYEMEIGGKKPITRKVTFPEEDRDFYVKTNTATMDKTIGHKDVPFSAKFAISNIRKHQAETQLLGFQDFEEVFNRMKHQTFDTNSPLNPFRTDEEEHTISQCMFRLNDLTMEFHSDRRTANSLKFEDKLPEGKKAKITVKCTEFK